MPLTFAETPLYYKDAQGNYHRILSGADMTGYRTASAQDTIDTAQNADIASRAKTDMLGIIIDGNSTSVDASIGQYVIVKNSTISDITDGLYTAAQAIPANTAISSEYLTAVNNGGFNSLGSGLSSLSTKLEKFGKTLYSGNFSGSGNISVPGIFGYALIGVFPTGGRTYMMIGSPTRGGLAYGTYNSTGVSHFAYRFDYVNDNTIAVNSLNRGITDGTNTTYSGHADCKITKIIGLIPNN